MATNLTDLVADLKEKEALETVTQRLNTGDDAMLILQEARKGMETVGERFARGEYFIPELVYSGEILKAISEIVKPKLKKAQGAEKRLGKIVMGTVAGDIHDIGKDIVTFMLEVNGFEVHDIGVDMPPHKFVEKIKEVNPDIVGMSGLLTLAFDSMKETVEAIKTAGLRDKVKIMIGGAQIDDGVRKYSGADPYGPDAMAAVALAKEWTKGKQK